MLSAVLFGLTLSTNSVVLVVAVGVAALCLGVALFRKDTEIENRRRSAIEAANVLRGHGLKEIPTLLTDYAVGDYSGLVTRAKDLSRRLADPVLAEAEFNTVFERLLDAKLKDPQRSTAFLADVTKRAALYKPAA